LCIVNQFLLTLIIYVPENIVQNEVSGRLLGKDEGLDKLLELGRFVGCFTDDLNDDVIVGCLGIDVGNADFAVLETEFLDALLYSLYLLGCEVV
jgi:hypothetical protein